MKRFLTLMLMAMLCAPFAAVAEKISMVIGLALPPYVIADQDTGIELEIVRESLAYRGHELVPVYVPFWRVLSMLEQGLTDAAMTVNEDSGIRDGVFYSQPHITYQNQAISLKSRSFPIFGIEDLAPYSILAFQNARKYLGADFAAMARDNPQYQEIALQAKQVVMLYAGRIDLVVMDKNIFNYYRQQEVRIVTDADVQRFELFPPSHYKVAFVRADWRDDFDAGLKYLHESGHYEAIVNRFITPSERP